MADDENKKKEHPSSPEKKKISSYDLRYLKRDFAFGIGMHFVSQGFQLTANAPFERLRIMMQVQHVHKGIPPEQRFKGILDCTYRIYKNQGILSFWRGNQVDVFKLMPQEYLQLMIPPIFKKAFVTADPIKDKRGYFWQSSLSSAMATFCYMLYLYPLDVLRVRTASDIGYKQSREFYGSLSCLKQIILKDGINGLYSGFFFQVTGLMLQRGLSYGAFSLAKASNIFDTSVSISFLIAMGISFGCEAITYPFAVLMKRMMMQVANQDKLFKSPLDCLKFTLEREGFRGFYRGYLLSLIITFNRFVMLIYFESSLNFRDLFN